jgi:hypothetical protein
MEPDTTPIQETEFVFRRLSDALQLGGKEANPAIFWPAVLVPILLLAVFYVGWMYVRDGRAVGKLWAAFLATLRCAVYFLLAWVFLLPAWQTWERSLIHSKVILLFDVSGSMGNKDGLPTEAVPVEKLLSRQDQVIRFLTDPQIAFLKKLLDKNPVTAYRFGSVVDEDAQAFQGEPRWSADDWAAWLKPDAKQDVPADLDEDARNKLLKKLDLYAMLVNGTNLGDSLMSVINKEANNMVQGIILVSDGRNTKLSTQIEEVQARARGARVPIFTVAVGEHRPPISIRITDLQVPDQARPDDKFPVRVEVDGEGLAGKGAAVTLEVTKPSGEKVTLQPALKPGESAVFKPGEPPHAQVEFEIDKPEAEGEWKFVAHIPKDKRENFIGKEHVTEPATVNVVKKPLRILLFGGPTRDYQLARPLFVREMDKQRVVLCICLQVARVGDIVQDVPESQMLRRFPGVMRAEDDAQTAAEDKYDNLAQYDLIIAFDPDWTQLTTEQMRLLEQWVGAHAGGLVVVAGPVNTYELARGPNYEKVKPILDLLPVIPEDSRLKELGVERSTAEPWRLNFPGANSDMEFLKLDEEGKDALAGWDEFFTGHQRDEGGKETTLRRGFYNYYPVRGVKPNATVVATFTDPRARLSDGKDQPYLVTMPYGSGKVVYISSGELWRLRQFHEAFHERFWTKLARYAGSGNLTRINRRGDFYMGKTFTANTFVALRAQLFGQDMQPLPRTEKPKATVTPPGSAKPITVEMQANADQSKDWNGWFTGRLLVTAAGNYSVSMQIPGTPDTISKKFVVKESNPELDNLMPDFDHLRQLASEAQSVLEPLSEPIKTKLKPELERTNKVQTKESANEERQPLKLYFDLKAAAMIPECMATVTKTQRSRGPVKDIWDEGFTIGDEDPPMKVSYALLAVVALLSLEWLTRKLLKLA